MSASIALIIIFGLLGRPIVKYSAIFSFFWLLWLLHLFLFLGMTAIGAHFLQRFYIGESKR